MANCVHNEHVDNMLLTGCYRSGTTLLDKVLHAHPGIVMASQAYPVLFYYAKQRFLDDRGLERRYPLDHLFLESHYAPDDLHEFLEEFVFDAGHLERLFAQMAAFTSGVWTPELLDHGGCVRPGTFWEVLTQLNACISHIFPRDGAVCVGSKEIMMEEYLPYLLAKGAKAVLVIRDPRDVIASTHYVKDGPMGANRPVLYGLRTWRRSVAFALGCESHSNFAWITYEALVRETRDTLDQLTDALGTGAYPPDAFAEGIHDQYGKLWKSNSSFDGAFGFDTSALGRYETRLPREVTAYIEAACYPEMRALGYPLTVLDGFDAAALKSYRDPFPVTHEKFGGEGDYSSDPARISLECERVERLVEGDAAILPEEARRWFIRPEAWRRLREAVG